MIVILRDWLVIAVIAVILGLLTNFIMDAAKLMGILNSPYQTPWYDKSWLRQPATNLVLSLYGESSLHETVNGDKSQVWLVEEIQLEGKTFWTILKQTPIPQ
jgi:hypothetical protein